MVKGCRRDSILLRGNEGEFFEEAYFIIRRDMPGVGKLTERDMVREARRILGEQTAPKSAGRPARLSFRQAAAWFLGGCAIGCLMMVVLVMLGVLS